ncbi:type VI secretion system PAAR protein [Thaumasiovibrio subtropicus]|uniref:type VI secretion system PAAR protein n=1 Tax=Thaumasiovibrio subtropicus TaxID=1891207 RepID=UPI000B35E5A9|nr:type VI secretion system PAAR protein [Thaumasiovibrio subtropicus]
MGGKAVKLGDIGTGHDGFPPTPVCGGSSNVFIDGKPAGREGDPLVPHSKPKHPPHGRSISSGASSVFINGKPAALQGGSVSCGGVTIGSGTVTIGDQPAVPTLEVEEIAPVNLPRYKEESSNQAQSILTRSSQSLLSHPLESAAHSNKIDPLEIINRTSQPLFNNEDEEKEKVFCKSCLRPAGDIEANEAPEPISNFGVFEFFSNMIFPKAHAAVPLPPPTVLQGSMATYGTGTAISKANDELAIELTKAGGNLKDAVLDDFTLAMRLPPGPAIAASLSLLLFRPDDHGDDTQFDDEELRTMGLVPSRIRIEIEPPAQPGWYPVVRAFHADSTYIPTKRVGYDNNGNLSVQLEDDGPTIFWTPDSPDFEIPSNTGHHGTEDLHQPIYTTPIPDQAVGHIEVYPMPEERTWRDYILIFPEDSGIKPIYVVYQRTRDQKGQYAPEPNKPYTSLTRPSLRAGTRRAIEAAADKNAAGQFVDENGIPIKEWHYGHKTGHENRRILVAAEQLGMTKEELNDFVNSHPEYFQIEEKYRNLSHKDELLGYDQLDDILLDMEDFLNSRR